MSKGKLLLLDELREVLLERSPTTKDEHVASAMIVVEETANSEFTHEHIMTERNALAMASGQVKLSELSLRNAEKHADIVHNLCRDILGIFDEKSLDRLRTAALMDFEAMCVSDEFKQKDELAVRHFRGFDF